MQTIKNLKLMSGDEPFNIDNNKQATTVRLLRVVLNNPVKGKNQKGEHEIGYEGLDEMRIGARILEKLEEAEKATKMKDGQPADFELEDNEVDLCKKYVPKYEPFFSTPKMLPFLEQFDDKK